MTDRDGFSLAELMVALVIAGVIGVALTRLMINQARFVSGQESRMMARAGARAGFNVIVQELRSVTYGGVVDAAPDSITVRVPVSYGVACRQVSGGRTGVALLPRDSALYGEVTISGYAWQDPVAGTWTYVEPATVGSGSVGDCTGASPRITTIPGGTQVRLTPNDAATPVGAPVYLYHTTRYALATSSTISGRLALWRTLLYNNTREELVVPFDTASTFGFLVGRNLTYQAAVPASLDSIRGIRLRLIGQSENAPQGSSSYATFDLTTDIIFMNRNQ